MRAGDLVSSGNKSLCQRIQQLLRPVFALGALVGALLRQCCCSRAVRCGALLRPARGLLWHAHVAGSACMQCTAAACFVLVANFVNGKDHA